mmetsp:Transcript_17500/g.52871  ORF Transcript_17500/g.52871 Transcript_17500/m.52871 type:complete len:374 (-) Transcript_17500:823-1944(-)
MVRVCLEELPLRGELLQLLLQAQLFLVLLLLLLLYPVGDLQNALLAVGLLGHLALFLLPSDRRAPDLMLLLCPLAYLGEGLGLLRELLLLFELLLQLPFSLLLQLFGLPRLRDLQPLTQLCQGHLLKQALAGLLSRVERLEALHRHLLQGSDLPDDVLSLLHLLLVLPALPLELGLLLLPHLVCHVGACFKHLLLGSSSILPLLLGLLHQPLFAHELDLGLLLADLELQLQLLLLDLGHDVALAHLALVGLDRTLSGQLHLDYPLVHTLVLLELILLPHLLLPAAELGGVMQVLLVPLEDLVLFRLLLLEESVLPQDCGGVLPHDGLLRGRNVLFRGFGLERALRHPLRLDFPCELLHLGGVLGLGYLQVGVL